MAWGWRIDLVGPIDCVRLSLHGGSLLAGVRPRLVTTRLPRAVRSRRSQISTISGTSPSRILRALAFGRGLRDHNFGGLLLLRADGIQAFPERVHQVDDLRRCLFHWR